MNSHLLSVWHAPPAPSCAFHISQKATSPGGAVLGNTDIMLILKGLASHPTRHCSVQGEFECRPGRLVGLKVGRDSFPRLLTFFSFWPLSLPDSIMMNGSNLANTTTTSATPAKSKEDQVVNGHDEKENNPFAEYMWMENEEDFNRQVTRRPRTLPCSSFSPPKCFFSDINRSWFYAAVAGTVLYAKEYSWSPGS